MDDSRAVDIAYLPTTFPSLCPPFAYLPRYVGQVNFLSAQIVSARPYNDYG